jgi:DNA-binding transcriptional MerR regulator
MARTRDYMTIGELVESLQPAHPDLTISKVRFLEDEGLVTPERTAGGYRKFSSQDAARVDLVLRLQKEHFLPLAVIREKLKDLDKGRVPEELRPMVTRPEAVSLPFEEVEAVTLEAAQSTMGLPVTFVRELAEFGLVRISKGDHGDELRRADVEVAHAAWDLRRFGVEARHLRTYVPPPPPPPPRRSSPRSSCRRCGTALPRRGRSSWSPSANSPSSATSFGALC